MYLNKTQLKLNQMQDQSHQNLMKQKIALT